VPRFQKLLQLSQKQGIEAGSDSISGINNDKDVGERLPHPMALRQHSVDHWLCLDLFIEKWYPYWVLR
jgi:hypothetical protein